MCSCATVLEVERQLWKSRSLQRPSYWRGMLRTAVGCPCEPLPPHGRLMHAAQSVGAAQGGKPSAVAAAALRTVFACLSQQAARGSAAALAGVPAHVRDSLWRDFSAAGARSHGLCIADRFSPDSCHRARVVMQHQVRS